MKLSSNSISALVFTALAVALFVLMAMRDVPPGENSAMNFGMPMNIEATTPEVMPNTEMKTEETTSMPVPTPEISTPAASTAPEMPVDTSTPVSPVTTN